MNKKTQSIGLLVSLALIALLAQRVDGAAVSGAFGRVHPWGLALVLTIHVSVLGLKAVRWATVLGALRDTTGRTLVLPSSNRADRWLVWDALFVGYFGNYVLPAKMGEFLRAGILAERTGAPLAAVLATILVERFIDALVLVFGFGLALVWLPPPAAMPPWVSLSAELAGLIAVLGIVTLLGLLLGWNRLPAAWVQLANRPLIVRILGVIGSFRGGLAILSDQPRVTRAVLWTMLIWSLEVVAVRLCFLSFDADLPWGGSVVQLVIASFAIAAPSAPGGLGIHQWVTLLVTAPYGIQEADAVSASLVLTFAVVLWVVPIGLLGLVRQGVGISRLRGVTKAPSQA